MKFADYVKRSGTESANFGGYAAGCSKTPIELLKLAGVDMSTPQPVNDALALFDELITELETLMLTER